MKLKRRFGVVLLMAMLVMAMTVTASAAKKVKLNKKSATLSIGKTVTLRVKNAGKKKVTWASSDVYVATVDDGVVTAVDAGTATIRATVGAKTLKCKVTVKAAAEQASVAIVGYSTFEPRLMLTGSLGSEDPLANTQALDVLKGTTQYDLKPHVQTNPAGAALTWTSSNEKVATVKDGVVKAVSDGTALITVSANGASDSIVAYVTGMGSDEETNPMVISMANYDRVFNKYFEKLTVRTVFLDVNGNIMDPTSLLYAYVTVDGKDHDITTHVREDFYEEQYYIVCKDSRVDTLKSYGSGNFLVWETVNDLTANGGEPVLKETKRLGLTNPNFLGKSFYWDSVQKDFVEVTTSRRATSLGVVTVPNAGNIPFKYFKSIVYNPNVKWDDKLPTEPWVVGAAGICKVTVSDPSMAGKSVLGFGPYGVSGKPQANVTYITEKAPWDPKQSVKVVDKISYSANAFTDETFREINFVLYLK